MLLLCSRIRAKDTKDASAFGRIERKTRQNLREVPPDLLLLRVGGHLEYACLVPRQDSWTLRSDFLDHIRAPHSKHWIGLRHFH